MGGNDRGITGSTLQAQELYAGAKVERAVSSIYYSGRGVFAVWV
jgi:hypothetical protein